MVQFIEVVAFDRRAAVLQEIDDGSTPYTIYTGAVAFVLVHQRPSQTCKLRAALEKTQYVLGAEWTSWFRGIRGGERNG